MGRSGRHARIAIGAVLWAGLAWLVRAQLADPAEGRDRRAFEAVRSYLVGRTRPLVLLFPEDVEVAVGDPAYLAGPDGLLVPAGEVRSLRKDGAALPLVRVAMPGDGVREVECLVRDDLPGGEASFSGAWLVSVPQGASWVLRTLLPPAKLELLAVEWNRALLEHREEIFAVLAPVMEGFLGDLQAVLAEDLPPALLGRRAELAALGRRLQEEVIQREFQPLAQTELWPIIQRRAQPTIDAISQELWNRLPVWSLTWRVFYQTLPLTGDHYLKEAMDRFWRQETVPILKKHAGDFLGIAQDIVKEAAANPEVSAAFRRSFDRAMRDPDLQHQLRLVFQEVILDNPRFHEAMARRFRSPEVVRAVDVLARKLEPMVRRMGDIVLGTRAGGITPEFARVLRTQILLKDRRWLLFEPESAGGAAGASRAGPRSITGPAIRGEVRAGNDG